VAGFTGSDAWGSGLPSRGGSDFLREAKVRAHQARKRRIIAEEAKDAESRQRERIRKVQEGPPPNRSFADQVEAMRRLCDRQLALLELQEQEHGVLPVAEFRMVQKLAFILRTLGQESRAQASGWDATKASDAELQSLVGNTSEEGDV